MSASSVVQLTPPGTRGRKGAGSAFRVPAPRAQQVARPALVEELRQGIAERRIVLVVAGAGFGKTTLLAQTLADVPEGWTVAWIAVDRLDRSPARMFRILVESINATHPGGAQLDADTLTRMVSSGEAGAREAAAEVAGWLSDLGTGRFVWVWDDIHVIDDPVAWRWLDTFVDMLPDCVCCVIASREAPQMPLAKRRAAGDLLEVAQPRLCFSTGEAREFLAALGEASADSLAQAWTDRTSGWVAGLRLLAAGRRGAVPGAIAASGTRVMPGDEQVFEYLAEEVFSRLPDEVAGFAAQCCVLDELDPPSCHALTGRDDSLEMIELIVRRNWFVSVVDPARPAIRLHDLFRDFLVARLRRRSPADWRSLNLRASAIVEEPLRAVGHAIDGEDPERALRLLATHAEALLRQGQAERVAELLRSLSRQGMGDHALAHWITGLLAWQRSAFDEGRIAFELAWRGFEEAGDRPMAVRSLLSLTRIVSYAGDVRLGAERLATIVPDGLEPALQAELALERAWVCSANGRPDEASRELATAIELAERLGSPELCGLLAERIRTHFVGTPRFSELFRRFHALVVRLGLRPDSLACAHATVLVGWATLWEGDFRRAGELLDEVWVDIGRWRAFRALTVDVSAARGILLAMTGRVSEGIALVEEVIRSGQTTTAGSRNAWVGTYLYLMGRLHWTNGDHEALRDCYSRLLTAFRGTEWPYMAPARRWAEALVAWIDGDWPRAARLMAEVVDAQRLYPVLSLVGDVRVVAVDALARSGRAAEAASLAEGLLDDALESGMCGRLLFERPALVAALADRVDPGHPRRVAWLAVLARCASLRAGPGGEAASASRSSGESSPASSAAAPVDAPVGASVGAPVDPAFGALTAREREVLDLLVRGDSNKRIALTLDISLHTVKRHVANILGKLGVRTRAEAIARRFGGG